jgi:hypothetical protein
MYAYCRYKLRVTCYPCYEIVMEMSVCSCNSSMQKQVSLCTHYPPLLLPLDFDVLDLHLFDRLHALEPHRALHGDLSLEERVSQPTDGVQERRPIRRLKAPGREGGHVRERGVLGAQQGHGPRGRECCGRLLRADEVGLPQSEVLHRREQPLSAVTQGYLPQSQG